MNRLLFVLIILFTIPTFAIDVNAGSRVLQTQDSTTVSINVEKANIVKCKIEWSTNAGVLVGEGDVVQYIAPDFKCSAVIVAKLTDANDHFVCDSVEITVYNQLVFLKADDIVFDKASTLSPRWIRFIEYIKKKNIKAGLGIIGNSLEKGNQAYFDLLKEIAQSSHFEFWNHGYDHQLKGQDQNGAKYREFWHTPHEHQREHLLKTQNLAKEKLGLTLHTFGAPGNAVDSITVKVLEENPDIKVWYYGLENNALLNLERFMNIEYPTHYPDFAKFKEDYNKQKTYLALQMHPCSWDDKRFAEFVKIIEFLIENDVTFINPFEYYQKL